MNYAPDPKIIGPSENGIQCDYCGLEEAEHLVKLLPDYRYNFKDILELDLCETCLALEQKCAKLPVLEADKLREEYAKRIDKAWGLDSGI